MMKNKFVVFMSIFLSLLLLSVFSLAAVSQEKTKPEVRQVQAIAPGNYVGPTFGQVLKEVVERYNEQVVLYLLHQQKKKPILSSTTSHRGYSTAKECASMVEHGGSYDESNNPSHKGRYQFSRPLWIANGGVAAHWDDWSFTTPAEQDAVFETAWYAPRGYNNWLPYDGCGPYDGS